VTTRGDRDAAIELATLIADASAARRDGRPPRVDQAHVRHLIGVMFAEGDARSSTTFFTTLQRELRARGATLPHADRIEPMVATLLADLPDVDEEEPDLDRLAEQLEEAVARGLGLPDRRAREAADAKRIDDAVAARIAASMRAHGLDPDADD
jgi:hypothetical protein